MKKNYFTLELQKMLTTKELDKVGNNLKNSCYWWDQGSKCCEEYSYYYFEYARAYIIFFCDKHINEAKNDKYSNTNLKKLEKLTTQDLFYLQIKC